MTEKTQPATTPESSEAAPTSGLDTPVRNASENQRMLAAILEDPKMQEERAQ